MKLIRSIEAYYPVFTLGCRPAAVRCELSIVEANEKRYLKTPFAFLNAFADDDPERQIGRGYYATEADCLEYLAHEYPWATHAEPIMDALESSRRHYGDLAGNGRIADRCDVTTDQVHKLARGHKSFTLKQIKAAMKLLTATVPA